MELVSWSQMDIVPCVLHLLEGCAGQLAPARHGAVCTLPSWRGVLVSWPQGDTVLFIFYLVEGCAGQLVTDGH